LTIRPPSPVVPEGYRGGRVRARELSWGLKNGNRVVFFGFEAVRSQEGNKEIFIDGFLEQKQISVDFKRWVFGETTSGFRCQDELDVSGQSGRIRIG
jgi:hypothetical protein